MQRVITQTDVARVAPTVSEPGLERFDIDPSGLQVPAVLPKQLVPDQYWTRLQKMIPAEIVAAFLAIDGVVQAKTGISATVYWVIYGLLVLMCVFYARRMVNTPGLKPDYRQVAIATVAFIIWTYAIGGPFAFSGVSWWIRALGGVLVVLWTTAAPLLIEK